MTRIHIISAAGSFVFLIMRLSLFAQPDSNGNATGTHEGTDDAGNTASWETRELPNMHFRFKLPPGYKQKQWAVVVGALAPSATFHLGHENHIDFTIENVEDANPENAKVGLQKDYVDYKEWSQVIGGHKGIVQTFQGGGITIDEEGERLPHRVEAICAVDAKHVLRISALLGNQERQQEAQDGEDNRILLIRKRPSNWLEPRSCGRLCT